MVIIDVENWEAFEVQLKELRENEIAAERTVDFLFRGLSDSAWTLATTLDRAGREGIRLSEYYHMISRARNQIESFTGMKWEITPWPEIEKALQDYDTWSLHRFPEPEAYGYMVYLRHHGFPSPLLDWTRSPYIAAFFAFRSAIRPETGKVSICVFSERPERYKTGGSGKPQIRRTGPYVTTHRRHSLQQSDYTMCATFEVDWRFAKHEDIFIADDQRQDVLWKFNILWAERLKVLKLLDAYNLNAFSLFGTEEGLMETIALREFEFRDAT